MKSKNIKKIIFCLILVIIVIFLTRKMFLKKIYRKEYAEYVSKYSQQYDVEEELIYAIIKAESNFNSDAISNKNAKGLMQIMDSTAEEIAEKINIEEYNIFEPNININIGTYYISELLKKYDCMEVAVIAYNAGSGNVDKWIENGVIKSDGSDIENVPYKETNNYVRKILRNYKMYKELYQ